MQREESKWRTIQVPTILIEDVEKSISQKGSRFLNTSAFCTDAIRQALRSVK